MFMIQSLEWILYKDNCCKGIKTRILLLKLWKSKSSIKQYFSMCSAFN